MQRETRLQNNRLARFLNFFSRKFHSKRMEFFRRVFRPAPETTILDVGGTDLLLAIKWHPLQADFVQP